MRAALCLMTMATSAIVILADNTPLIVDNDMYNSTDTILLRRKRYIVFPKGSSLQLNLELLPRVPNAPNEIVAGPTIGVAWELPTKPENFIKPHQREKRTSSSRVKLIANHAGVLRNLQTVFDLQNINGKDCILRALCESKQRTPKQRPFILEFLHIIFHLKNETELADDYHKAYSAINANCLTLYKNCPFSFFDV